VEGRKDGCMHASIIVCHHACSFFFFFLARNLAGVSVKEQKTLRKYTSIKKKKKEKNNGKYTTMKTLDYVTV
jgi:hypothetical protein